jgi:hypothetical protein
MTMMMGRYGGRKYYNSTMIGITKPSTRNAEKKTDFESKPTFSDFLKFFKLLLLSSTTDLKLIQVKGL